jgi:hypothetical protein
MILDGNGVNIVFDEEKDSILKLTYERTGGINRGWRAIQLFPTRGRRPKAF